MAALSRGHPLGLFDLRLGGVSHLGRMAERFVTETIHDKTLDVSLRPGLFADFQGQGKVKERLELAVEAARQRKESLDHILLSGPPGLGKTTLAHTFSPKRWA
jgi:holliday junction DNA helicase RuvB